MGVLLVLRPIYLAWVILKRNEFFHYTFLHFLRQNGPNGRQPSAASSLDPHPHSNVCFNGTLGNAYRAVLKNGIFEYSLISIAPF
jgi:hypothetical protein